MRSIWAAALLLRRIRADRGSLALLLVVIVTTSFLLAAAPRLLNRVTDDALRTSLSSVTAAERDVRVTESARIPSVAGGGVSGPASEGDRLAEGFPPTLAALFSGRTMVVTTVRLDVPAPPIDQTRLSLRYQDGLTEVTRLVAGRWPQSRGVPLQPGGFGSGSDGGGTDSQAPVTVEAALSTAEARRIGVGVGDRLAVTADETDPLVGGTGPSLGPTEVLVVGLFEPLDPNAADWSGDTSLLEVALTGSLIAPVMNATAYVSAAIYPDLFASGLPFRYEWRFHFDPDRLDAGQIDAMATDLTGVMHSGGPLTGRLGVAPEVTSALPAILQRFTTQLALTESVLALAALGPIALAGGAVAMLAGLLARRRVASVALARGRGASAALVLGAQVWEALVLAGGGALVGLGLAVVAVPARASPLSAVLAIATVGVAVLLLAAASWPAIRRPLGAIEREGRPGRRAGARRIVIELTVVAIAVIGAVLLAQRGVVISPSGAASGQVARFDPLLAAVPVLAGLAAGILATRLYPLPVRAFAWLAARRRDVVPVLGLWTIGRDPASTSLPLVVLLMAAAFGAFSSVVASSLDQGQVTAAALTVGADYRVESKGIAVVPPASSLAALPGVEAVAPAFVDPRTRFLSVPSQLASTYLDAIDPRAYATVTVGSAADPRWPAVFLDLPPASGAGTAAAPIPAILSSRLPNGTANLGPGATFDMFVNGVQRTFRLVEQRAAFAGLGGPPTFAIVPLPWVDAALGSQAPRPSVLWLRAPASIAGSLRDAVEASGAELRVVSRAEALAALRDAPLTAVVSAGYGLALVVAAGYMALAFVGAIVLSTARRSRDLAYLRTLGVSPLQSLGLTVVEHGPTVVLALAAGVALGLGLALELEPALGLDGFVGMSGVPPSIDWSTLAAMVLGLAAVVASALLGGTWLSRQAPVTDVLRIGEA